MLQWHFPAFVGRISTFNEESEFVVFGECLLFFFEEPLQVGPGLFERGDGLGGVLLDRLVMLMQLGQLLDLQLKLSSLLHQEVFVLHQHVQFILKYSNSLRDDFSELFKKEVGIRVGII